MQKCGDRIPGNHNIAFIHGCGGALDRLKEGTARIPYALFPLICICEQNILGPERERERGQGIDRRLQGFRAGTVQSDKKVCVGACIRELLAEVILGAGDDFTLHEFHGRRIAAASENLRDRSYAGVQIIKGHEQGKIGLGFRQQLNGQPGQESECAF